MTRKGIPDFRFVADWTRRMLSPLSFVAFPFLGVIGLRMAFPLLCCVCLWCTHPPPLLFGQLRWKVCSSCLRGFLFLLLPFVLEFSLVCSDIPLILLSCVWAQVLQEDTGLISSPLLKQGQVEPLHVMLP